MGWPHVNPSYGEVSHRFKYSVEPSTARDAEQVAPEPFSPQLSVSDGRYTESARTFTHTPSAAPPKSCCQQCTVCGGARKKGDGCRGRIRTGFFRATFVISAGTNNNERISELVSVRTKVRNIN
jgi:hypothetical protein